MSNYRKILPKGGLVAKHEHPQQHSASRSSILEEGMKDRKNINYDVLLSEYAVEKGYSLHTWKDKDEIVIKFQSKGKDVDGEGEGKGKTVGEAVEKLYNRTFGVTPENAGEASTCKVKEYGTISNRDKKELDSDKRYITIYEYAKRNGYTIIHLWNTVGDFELGFMDDTQTTVMSKFSRSVEGSITKLFGWVFDESTNQSKERAE